jgi:tRNA G26 N,N-dimethylase Trm1
MTHIVQVNGSKTWCNECQFQSCKPLSDKGKYWRKCSKCDRTQFLYGTYWSDHLTDEQLKETVIVPYMVRKRIRGYDEN